MRQTASEIYDNQKAGALATLQAIGDWASSQSRKREWARPEAGETQQAMWQRARANGERRAYHEIVARCRRQQASLRAASGLAHYPLGR